MSLPWHAWITEASSYAAQVDLLVAGLFVLIVLLTAPVVVLIAVYTVKYRRGKPADRSGAADQRIGIEVGWALLPFLALIGFYFWSTELFFDQQSPPEGALQIDVVAKQWMWKFQHPGGQREINALHVPEGRPVALTMASQDVIHSLYVPALRIKQDVVPGRYTHLWFTADKPGRYTLACAEFCGTNHSAMGGEVVVMTPGDYTAWLGRSDLDRSLAAEGAALFRNHGCSGCHGASATVHAPPLEGLYGSPVPLADGSVVTADARYLRDSILLPHSQVAAGYQPIMPSFQNVLSDGEVQKLVAYIQSLQGDSPETIHDHQ